MLDVRMDAGYTHGDVMDAFSANDIRFVGRLAANPVLQAKAAQYLKRPDGPLPPEGREFTVELGLHSAESWTYAQRVILVVTDRPDAKTRLAR